MKNQKTNQGSNLHVVPHAWEHAIADLEWPPPYGYEKV